MINFCQGQCVRENIVQSPAGPHTNSIHNFISLACIHLPEIKRLNKKKKKKKTLIEVCQQDDQISNIIYSPSSHRPPKLETEKCSSLCFTFIIQWFSITFIIVRCVLSLKQYRTKNTGNRTQDRLLNAHALWRGTVMLQSRSQQTNKKFLLSKVLFIR